MAADLRWPKEPCFVWSCTLAPLGECDGSISAAAAMRAVATITVVHCFVEVDKLVDSY